MERITTNILNQNTLEHLHRYAIAGDFVPGKIVLDIASGEGYGSNILAETAEKVTGIDIDSGAVELAKKKYKKKNLSFMEGSATDIPLDQSSVDVVISFETIEHIDQHDHFMNEIKRVLRPGGLLIISSPDREIYSDLAGFNNPFHVKELNKKEFEELISRYFKNWHMLGQGVVLNSIVTQENMDSTEFVSYGGSFEAIHKTKFPGKPSYHICIASDEHVQLGAMSSIFHLEDLFEIIIKEKQGLYKNSLPFKIGSFILNPIKKIWGK